MKITLPHSRRIKQPVLYTLLAFVLLTFVQLPATAGSTGIHLYKDSILVNKLLISKKYRIRIYPGAGNETLFFNASGEEGKVYQFFLFDIDGNMVKQTQIRNKQTTILTNFNKGSYTFEVFSDDEHIENGTVTIK
jgi:hypothetical protein